MPPAYLAPAVSTTVVASPSAAAETVIAQVVNVTADTPTRHVDLDGWAAFTVGTSGTACTLRIRQTGVAGTLVASSGAVTGGIAATNLVTMTVSGFDLPGDITAFTYVLTLQVTGGAATSTVSAVKLRALVCQ